MNKNKLIIVDSYFKSYSGHNFFYNLNLAKNLNKKYKLDIFANKNLKLKSRFPASIKKYFDDYQENKQSIFFKILKKLSFLKKYKFFLFLNEKKNNLINRSNKYNYLDYRKKIINILNKNYNILFFHSETGNKFQDILDALLFFSENIKTRKIFILDRIGSDQNSSVFQIIKYLGFKNNIFFLTDSHNIKKKYIRNNIPINLFPNFVQFDKKFRKKKNKKLNVSLFIGPARKEKGFLNIPNLIFKINKIKNIYLNLNYSMDSKNIKKDNVNVVLNKINKFDVKIINSELTENQYINFFQETDILIMNYDHNSYKRERTSAVFLDAISNFVIPIVKKNTWMSSFIEKNKILKNLIITNNNQIQKSIIYIKENKIKILNEIKILRLKILKNNNNSNVNKFFKVSKNNKNIFKAILYLNNNFYFKKDIDFIKRNNFRLIKKFSLNTDISNKLNFLNKILLHKELKKLIDNLNILFDKNFYNNFNQKNRAQIGLFKSEINNINVNKLKYNSFVSKFLFSNTRVNTVYTLMKIK